MPIRLGDTAKQVNDSILYPVVTAADVEVVDTAGNFGPPSIRSYKDLESVLAELASGSASSGTQFTALFSNSLLAAGDVVGIVSTNTVDRITATDPDVSAVGICIAVDSPSAGSCTVQTAGTTTFFSGPGSLVATTKYILSTSEGAIIDEDDDTSSIYPSGSGDYFQYIGEALSATTFLIKIDNLIENA